MRTFISIEFPENIKQEIIKIQKEIEALGLVRGQMTEKENLHLTLKFLGEVDEKEIEKIEDKLKNFNFKLFSVKLDKLGVFDKNFIRIVWISAKGELLWELQKALDIALEEHFPKEIRFMGHITICRPKSVKNREQFIDALEKIRFEKSNFKIDKIVLKKSELSSKGPKYFDLMVIKSKERI